MELFFEVQRQKQHIFLDAKESEGVIKLKQMIERLIKVPPQKQRLYTRRVRFVPFFLMVLLLQAADEQESSEGEWQLLDDNCALGDCGFNAENATAQCPLVLALTLQVDTLLNKNLMIYF